MVLMTDTGRKGFVPCDNAIESACWEDSMSTAAVQAAGAQPASEAQPTSSIRPQADERLVSLDAFRGFIMFWIVGGSALMLGLQQLGANPVFSTIVAQLRHTDWQGLRFYDLIWPAFMLMTGMSVPFSYAKRSLTQTHREIFWR